MKQIVLCVEGFGDCDSSFRLASKVLSGFNAFHEVAVDPKPIRVGDYNHLAKSKFSEWRRFLSLSRQRKNAQAVLLLLDADALHQSCHVEVAKQLAQIAVAEGASSIFSVAVVFARQEFESWLLASFSSFVGKSLPRQTAVISTPATEVPSDLESHPRDAKKLLRELLKVPYEPTIHRHELAKMVDIELLRTKMRSFRRFENALSQLVEAIKYGNHIATPQ